MVLFPIVSVIIPCYNYGRFLSNALDSILAQTYANWECLVVNDGSTDTTEAVATHYAQKDARFKYVYQNNSGVSSARNKALEQATGTYIQLLDADDLLEKDKLALQVAYLEENTTVDLVYSSMIFFKDGDEKSQSEPRLLQNKSSVSGSGEAMLRSLLDDNLFLPGCTLARKSLYDDVGVFTRGIEGIEDWDYFYRAALLQKEFYHDGREGTRLLVRFHGNNASANRYKMWSHIIKARKALMQQTEDLLENKNSGFSKPFIAQACNVHKALLNRDRARLNLLYGNIFKGGIQALKHGYHSRKPFFAFYDGAYWIKERLKKKHSTT
jgi:glycosyltransferase involved in cell wall biosynthesis